MLNDILFVAGIAQFTALLCFGVPIMQTNSGIYCLLNIGMVACMVALGYRAGKKKGRRCGNTKRPKTIEQGMKPVTILPQREA